jgi:HSF-type DNA-binding
MDISFAAAMAQEENTVHVHSNYNIIDNNVVRSMKKQKTCKKQVHREYETTYPGKSYGSAFPGNSFLCYMIHLSGAEYIPCVVAVRTDYIDYLQMSPPADMLQLKSRGGAKVTFPSKLHGMLDYAQETGKCDVLSWLPHGRAFLVNDKERFVTEVLPLFFQLQKEYASFQRQLNIYGFMRLTKSGPDQNAYYHPLFLRGRPNLCNFIGPKPKDKNFHSVRRSIDPATEPDFYSLPFAPEQGGTTTTVRSNDRSGPTSPASMAVSSSDSAIQFADPTRSAYTNMACAMSQSYLHSAAAATTHTVGHLVQVLPACDNTIITGMHPMGSNGRTNDQLSTGYYTPSSGVETKATTRMLTEFETTATEPSESNVSNSDSNGSCFSKEDKDLMFELFAAEDCLPGNQQLPPVDELQLVHFPPLGPLYNCSTASDVPPVGELQQVQFPPSDTLYNCLTASDVPSIINYSSMPPSWPHLPVQDNCTVMTTRYKCSPQAPNRATFSVWSELADMSSDFCTNNSGCGGSRMDLIISSESLPTNSFAMDDGRSTQYS